MKKMVLLLTALIGIDGAEASADVLDHTGAFRNAGPESVTLNYEDQNITDDSIAESIRPPRPRSLSDVCREISEHAIPGRFIDLDLSSNTICDEGAGTLAKKLVALPLSSLDVSWNRMSDDGIHTLVVGLKPLLLKSTFKTLSIRGNYGANAGCMRNLASLLIQTEFSDIIGKISF